MDCGAEVDRPRGARDKLVLYHLQCDREERVTVRAGSLSGAPPSALFSPLIPLALA